MAATDNNLDLDTMDKVEKNLDRLADKPLYAEFLDWVNDGVTKYHELSDELRMFLYRSFISIARNSPNKNDYKSMYLSKNKNVDVWSLQSEPGKARPKWKQIRNNVGYSDPSYFTVRHVLESIPMARSLTKGYRDLEREEKIRNYLAQQMS